MTDERVRRTSRSRAQATHAGDAAPTKPRSSACSRGSPARCRGRNSASGACPACCSTGSSRRPGRASPRSPVAPRSASSSASPASTAASTVAARRSHRQQFRYRLDRVRARSLDRSTPMTVAQYAVPTTRGSSRWLLLGSLALNLFFVGVAVAMAVRAPAPPAWDRNVFVRVEHIAATLPPADADLLRGADQRQPRRSSTTRRPNIIRRRTPSTRRCGRSRSTSTPCAPPWRKTRAARQNFDQVIQGVFACLGGADVAGRPPGLGRLAAGPQISEPIAIKQASFPSGPDFERYFESRRYA